MSTARRSDPVLRLALAAVVVAVAVIAVTSLWRGGEAPVAVQLPGPDDARQAPAPTPTAESLRIEEPTESIARSVAPAEIDALAGEIPDTTRGTAPCRVLDDRGDPVTEFLVRARPTDRTRSSSSRQVVSETGRVTLDLLRGQWNVEVSGSYGERSGRIMVDVPSEEVTVFQLDRPATLSGHLVDRNGAPWQRQVRARIVRHRLQDTTIGAMPEQDGSFKLQVASGQIRLRADDHMSPVLELELEPGEHRYGLVLRELPAAWVVATLADEVTPRNGRSVTLRDDSGHQREKTDAEGVVRFQVVPGTVHLTASRRLIPYSESAERFEVAAGETRHVTLGAVSSRRIVIHGDVSRRGEPVPGARVMCMKFLPSPDTAGLYGSNLTEHCDTDELGAYEISVGSPGEFEFIIRLGNTASGDTTGNLGHRFVEVPEVARHRVDFELGTSSLSGVIVTRTGAPVDFGGAWLVPDPPPDSEPRRWVQADMQEGTFRIDHVDAGTYSLIYTDVSPAALAGPTPIETTEREGRIDGILVTEAEHVTGLVLRLR